MLGFEIEFNASPALGYGNPVPACQVMQDMVRAPAIHQKCCIGIQQGYSRYSRYSTNPLILGVGNDTAADTADTAQI